MKYERVQKDILISLNRSNPAIAGEDESDSEFVSISFTNAPE